MPEDKPARKNRRTGRPRSPKYEEDVTIDMEFEDLLNAVLLEPDREGLRFDSSPMSTWVMEGSAP